MPSEQVSLHEKPEVAAFDVYPLFTSRDGLEAFFGNAGRPLLLIVRCHMYSVGIERRGATTGTESSGALRITIVTSFDQSDPSLIPMLCN